VLIESAAGLFCPAGDFHVDPWGAASRAVITHAHGDHARLGSASYLCAEPCGPVLRRRFGPDVPIETLPYGERRRIGSVDLSFHPAGHVLGSAQIRIEGPDGVWVAAGDYKRAADPTCAPFEPIRCDTFITESTFGLPIYRWQPQAGIFTEINAWWRDNAAAARVSVLYCYAFGKAQRILFGLDPAVGPILAHGAVLPLTEAYRAAGVSLPEFHYAGTFADKARLQRAVVLAPPSAQSTSWLRRFGEFSDAFASGWMQLRGTRRRRGVDRGFALSDHADWPGLQSAIAATGAERVFVTHGYSSVMVRWLRDRGLDAQEFATEYGEEDDSADIVQADNEAHAEHVVVKEVGTAITGDASAADLA